MQDDRCANYQKSTIKPSDYKQIIRKTKKHPSISNDVTYEILSIEHCYLDTEPLLKLSNYLVTLNNYRRVPMYYG